MKSEILTKYRFPVLFGGFLMMAYFGFTNRQSFLGDLETKRAHLFQVDDESNKQILEATKREFREKARS